MSIHETPSATVLHRRPLSVAFCCALLLLSGQAADTDVQTAGERLDQLRRTRSDSKVDLAQRLGLEFCFACAIGDGTAATKHLPAIGFQPLPASGPLPLQPDRPAPRKVLRTAIDQLPDQPVPNLPASRFRIVGRDVITARFGGVGRWMLPDDYALLIEPDPALPGWVSEPAFLVIRIAGPSKRLVGQIVGGNLLTVLLGTEVG